MEGTIVIISVFTIVIAAVYKLYSNEKAEQHAKALMVKYEEGYKSGSSESLNKLKDEILKINAEAKQKAFAEINIEKRVARADIENEKKQAENAINVARAELAVEKKRSENAIKAAYAEIERAQKCSTAEIENNRLRSEKDISLRIQNADYTAEQIKMETQIEIDQIRKAIVEKEHAVNAGIEANQKRFEQLEGIRRVLIRKEVDIRERTITFDKILEEKTKGFPWLAGKIAEYYTAKDVAISEVLKAKKNPSLKGSEEVKRVTQEKKQLLTQLKYYQYQLVYYENLFPWITEYRDIPDDLIQQVDEEASEEQADPAFKYFTPSETQKLSKSEIFQKALDRYISRRKSNWEIGRDYERYIGHQFEVTGHDVYYFGATEGLQDMGRDLIVKKGKETKIVQCKYWAQDKIIHEKHIFQLFGTAVMYAVSQVGMDPRGAFATLNAAGVSPVFVCACCLSDTARNMAEALDVIVREQCAFDPEYPRIKCNIGKNNERIYHLPFDQMYDKIKIEPHKDELYAKTITEAEKKGFRRAWRWKGNG